MKYFFTALIFSVFFSCICNPATAQQTDTTKEKAALKALVTNYENAWNRHDSKGLADNYDTAATWVNWFGAYYKGKLDIQQHYEAVHTTYFKSSQYYTRAIEDISFVQPGIAIMHVRTGLTGDERYPGQTFEFRRMLILTKKNWEWHILAGQNAKLADGVKYISNIVNQQNGNQAKN